MKKDICILISVILAFLGFCLFVLVQSVIPKQYVTTNINDYGNYIGNRDNDFANEFITSFFPEKIEKSFSNIKYSYRAQKNDTYAFEAYLQFQIEDSTVFQKFIADNALTDSVDFRYDSSFKERVIADELQLTTIKNQKIQFAKIGKILYSEETHEIIYVAIGVYDGGIVSTEFLSEYFNRFNIDPIEYQSK